MKKLSVVDYITGKYPDMGTLVRTWHKELSVDDIEGFAVGEDGTLYLLDECGRWDYVDMEKEGLKIV